MGIEPTHSHLWCDALPIEIPSPWEQAGGKEGYTSVGSWCPITLESNFLLWNTPGSDNAVTVALG